MSSPPERWLETGRLAELGLLTAELVHELRQPVFAIKALAQLAAARNGTADPATLGLILDQVETLETLLHRYAGSGRRPAAAASPVILGHAVEAGVALLRPRAAARGRALLLDLEVDRFAILGDAVAIQQVTANLVANALDAARGTVRVRSAAGVLEVSDDGAGLPPEVQARLFEPFFTTKPPGQGTGLGLAVSRELVEGFGGTISFETSAQGTRFVVSFRPADAPPAESP